MNKYGVLLAALFLLALSFTTQIAAHGGSQALVEVNGEWVTENPLHHYADHADLTIAADLAPSSYVVGESITFEVNEDLRTGSNGQLLKFRWNFGDGSQQADGVNANHRYIKPGTYIVSLLYAQGETSYYPSTAILVHVVPSPNYHLPVSSISAPPTFEHGKAIQFSASNSSGNIKSYQWDFGNKAGATTKEASHTYETDANKKQTVFLRVTDENGLASDAAVFLEAKGVTEQKTAAPLNLFEQILSFFRKLFS